MKVKAFNYRGVFIVVAEYSLHRDIITPGIRITADIGYKFLSVEFTTDNNPLKIAIKVNELIRVIKNEIENERKS